MTLLAVSLAELNRAQPGYLEAANYYSGDVLERFPSVLLQTLLAETGKRHRINFAATPVDAVAELLSIDGFTGDKLPVDTFNNIWEDNDFGLEALSVHKNACIYGDSYVIVWPDETAPTGVAMYSHSPIDVRVFYDPEAPRTPTHAVHRWVAATPAEQDPENRPLTPGRYYVFVNMYFPDRVERYVSFDPIDDVTNAGAVSLLNYTDPNTVFSRFAEDEVNEFDFLPVFHFRNARPYGRPEHADAFTVQDMINKTLANMMNSLDFAGYPQRYALSDSRAAADAGYDDLDLASDAPVAEALNSGGFKAAPGETWLIENAKSVGQFSTADASNFLEPINGFVKYMGTVTDTPVHLFDLGGNVPSGESLKASVAPLHNKARTQQRGHGVTWRSLANGVLAMAGVAAEPGAVQVVWSPLEQATTKEEWEVLALKVAAGVPRRDALIQAGYLPDVVDAWLAEPTTAPGNVPAADDVQEDTA